MVKYLIIILFIFVSCNKSLPSVPPRVGTASYVNGPVKPWQKNSYPVLQKALGIADSEKEMVLKSGPAYQLKFLLKDESVNVWEVKYRSFDDKPLQAYLIFPKEPPSKKLASIILLHGHESSADEAAFDNKNYMKGMGYKLAKRGFAVMVPQIRGFYNFAFQHNRYVKKIKRNFMGTSVLDIMMAQSILDSVDGEKTNGFMVDSSKNAIVGVEFGGLASLFTGALDTRFEMVSTQGIFVGFEEVFSSRHHVCEHVNTLGGILNMDDVALMVYPRKLHIAMSEQDKFYDESSKMLLQRLENTLKPLKPACSTDVANAQDLSKCQTVLELSPNMEPGFIISGNLEKLYIPLDL